MENLKDNLRAVANEYARQTTRLLNLGHYEWVGEDTFGLCIIDDEAYLTLEEMQVIIDNLDHWVSIYGTREKVADVIREWQQWWQADASNLIGVNLKAVHTDFFPNINLRSWLMGLRETKAKRGVSEARLRFQFADIFANEWHKDTRIGYILDDLQQEYQKAKDKEDAEMRKLNEQLANGTAPEQMQRAYDEFKAATNNE